MILREALAGARARLQAAGSDEASIEAEVLLRYALGIDRTTMLRVMNEPLSAAEAAAFERALYRRLQGEPVAYITGHREFYGLDFNVTPDTLIPRPETEMLVEEAIALLRERGFPVFADVGTGSGAIAVSIATAVPQATGYATDLSPGALDVARRNAAAHGVHRRLSFRRGDLLEPLDCRVNLLVANLPYVTLPDWQALPASIRDFEPRSALESGTDGLDAIRSLLRDAPAYLQPGGSVLLEFGIGQAEAIKALAESAFPGCDVRVEPDFAGIPRMLVVSSPRNS